MKKRKKKEGKKQCCRENYIRKFTSPYDFNVKYSKKLGKKYGF